ncbi:hypothetical protein ABEB36_004510 [Hypothenemus hampei]|uniref:Receptor expression-enhancing protein n=1 Tax=Hypothenemus hampei TaxID=57062 RepID=A0ABD1F687_HYPHA
MISSIISRVVILVFGTLYPAYASYKAVKTKNVKEYVKWMMYWIVFALFTSTETFTDIFLSWFPFYYEIKIILVIWLLSPATKGSSILYRKFVHPMLSSREHEIDEYISKAKEQSYKQVLDLGQKGVTVLMQTALKGGGGIVNQLRKSYSLGDLANSTDQNDGICSLDPPLTRRRKTGRSPHRSISTSSASVYFSEVDLGDKGNTTDIGVAEDISSGYSSGEIYATHQPLKLQARESVSSQRTGSLTRSRSTRATSRSGLPKKTVTSDDSDENEVFETNIVFNKDRQSEKKHESSSSESEFFDIPDNSNTGVDLHGKTFRISNSSNTSQITLNSELPLLKSNRIDVIAAAHGYESDSKITACKNDPFSTLNHNLAKLALNFSSFHPPINPTTFNKIKEVDMENRGGKYNKKQAPLPPRPTHKVSQGSPIKATLVLQPGVVRHLSLSAESLNKEIFLNYSPKVRRKSRNLSPVSRSSKSSEESKAGNALKKMLKLPRKMAQLNISGKVKEKRNSFNEFFHVKKLVDTKTKSKSASNLELNLDKRSNSQVSIRSLTDSPMAHRRLKVIRRYVDNDID